MTANDSSPDDETVQRLVAEIEVPAPAIGLAATLADAPDVVVEGDQLVPSWEDQLPYLWVTDGDLAAFEDAVADDPTVAGCERTASFDSGSLYDVEWADADRGLRAWLRRNEIPILEADASGATGEWQLKLRLESRDRFTDLQAYCDAEDIGFDLLRLYPLEAPKVGQYNVSEKQREALLAAHEMGYFEIPRECKLGDVADRLGISTRSASERLRRGQANLLTDTLRIGHSATRGPGETGGRSA
ncbi:helix-turn-helix domain-containing protein [Halorussus sp. AFM4]|uniref:helix-turn-helix domain-containing protein n=1 Tax=Halorussus sp. AFM4 TaxID=3421651 RepID=UPI003EBCF645